jgi:5-hydroxyisourate hydrolase-like protein (transthyretin family)
MIRLFLMLAACVYAQQSVRGVVEDASGAPVASAKVSLTRTGPGAAAVSSAKLVSGADGRFEFQGVETGEYTLLVKAKDFANSEKAVRVANAPVEIRVKLKVEAKTESVEVTADSSKVAESVVSANRNADRLNFDEAMLDALPVQGGDSLALVAHFLSPAAQGAEGVNITVDGVESSASAIPASAIRRVRVNRNPYALQFRRPGKARLEAYSEEGSMRRVRGAFGISLRNSVFDARNAFAPVKPDLTRSLVDFNLSGPIAKGRSSLYLNGEHYRNNENAVVNARTLQGRVVENVAAPERRTRLLARFERRGEMHQTTTQYGFVDESQENRNAGGLRLAEQGIPASSRAHRFQLSDRVLLFGKLLHDLRMVAQREETSRGLLAVDPAIQVHGAFTGGPSQTLRVRNETSLRLHSVSSMRAGRHDLRFGLEVRPAFFDSIERQNFGGTYEFSGLDSFASGRALLYRVNRGDPSVRLQQHEAYGFVQDEVALFRGFQVTYGVRYGWQSDVTDRNNFAPRMGLAFSPGRGGKTVIRGGAGVFHERITEDVNRRSLLWDGVRMQEFVVPNAAYPIDPSNVATKALPSIIRAVGLVNPVLTQASIGVEQGIGKRVTVAAEYQRLKGTHLLRSRNLNSPRSPLGGRPDSRFLNINAVESSASMKSDALSLTLRGSAGKWFSGMLQYTLSSTEDDTSGPFELPANSYDLRPEWGRSDYDQRHQLNAVANLDLRKGYRIGTFVTFATGTPLNITAGQDINLDSIVNDRPGGINRNSGVGPGLARVDVRFTKLLRMPRVLDRSRKSTSRNVELSIDAFNLFNTLNAANYIGVVTSPFYGRANAALAPRTIQISLRYKL